MTNEALVALEDKRKFWGKMIWISAGSVVFMVLLAVSLPILGIIKAFGHLKNTGAADPASLASDISTAMMIGILALPFAFLSLVFFILAIVQHRKLSNPNQTS